jgi:UDP-N-acetylglucosamine transferase subunit ALG13
MEGIEHGKVVVSVPRRKKYDEHTDDHQLQIVKEMKNKGTVIEVRDIKNLEDAIQKARKLKPKKRVYKNSLITELISEFLKDLEKQTK